MVIMGLKDSSQMGGGLQDGESSVACVSVAVCACVRVCAWVGEWVSEGGLVCVSVFVGGCVCVCGCGCP